MAETDEAREIRNSHISVFVGLSLYSNGNREPMKNVRSDLHFKKYINNNCRVENRLEKSRLQKR